MNVKRMRQMMMAATKRVRVARAMVMAMRVVCSKEGKGDKEDDGIGTRVAWDEKGNGNGCKSNDDKGDG